MTPSIGRVVHFVGQDGSCQAALVTAVERQPHPEGPVSLVVFPPQSGGTWEENVPFAAEPSPGTWHWPELVK